MSEEIAAARATLAGIPTFADEADTAAIWRLGGLTNRVFEVVTARRVAVLRLPGAGTEAYIDRKIERHNAEVAARAGVSPEVLYFNGGSGVMLTTHVPSVTMNADRFRNLAAVGRAGKAFRQLHASGLEFAGRFDVFAKMDEYEALLDGLKAVLPAGYRAAKSQAECLRQALAAVALAPCHCDPLAENFLDAGERMWIVDWEYSGSNDPMWDLGDLSVEAGFTPEQDNALLHAYFAGPAPAIEQARMMVYKAMCDLLWTLWGVIQHANGNPADNFQTYAAGRLDRCQRLMATEDYAAAIAIL